jgi:hypothetical protein
MNRMLAVAMIVTTIVGCLVARATADEHGRFRFEVEQTESHRGRGVAGWAYNDLPWRVTNVRLRVDCLDESGTVTESATGWVLGDVSAGGRAYFYVGVSSPAATVRVSVQSFDKVAREAPEAP